MTKGPKTAQETKVAAITPAGSIDLAVSLVQVGIANICYHRDILPLDNFKTVKVQGLEKVDTKMLVTGEDASAETNVINDWLTNSVTEALKTGYATKLIFGLSEDAECRNIFEEYVFVFEHDEYGNISLSNLEDGKGRTRAAAILTKPSIMSAKKQVSSLLRNIVYVTSTLGNIPDERYVFMKMEFSDDCPEDYQPSGFCDAGDNAVGFFSTKPFSMRLGVLNTPYHNVLLGVRSVLEDMDTDPHKGPTADDISRWETTMVTGDDGGEEGNNSAELDHHLMRGGYAPPHGQTNDDLADLFETEPQSAPQEEDVAKHLQRLKVGAPSQGAAGKSCAGGIYSVPGSARTESRAYNAVSNALYNDPNFMEDDEVLSDAAEDEGRGADSSNNKYAQTQVSGDHCRKKVSKVKEPVYQNTKGKRNAKSPPSLQKNVPTKRVGLRSTMRGAAVVAEH